MTQTNYIERYWRDATPEDAIKEPPMVSRFKLSKDGVWFYGKLYGIDRTRGLLFVCGQCVTPFCQVYDAPDPGEGYRLVDIENEKPKPTDEYLGGGKHWVLKGNPCDFVPHGIYRRRIAPPTPRYVPFTWEDREQLRGRWITRDNQELQLVNLDNSDGFFANGVHVVNLCLYWKFIDTGNPVGKEVTQ